MKVVKGDLLKLAFDGMFDVIIHGCNCHKAMGGGIARQIAMSIPEMQDADKNTPNPQTGNYSSVMCRRNGNQFLGVNFYTQFYPGADFKLQHLVDCINKFNVELNKMSVQFNRKIRIGVPMIGCGIGGGDVNEVMDAFKGLETNKNVELTVVIL